MAAKTCGVAIVRYSAGVLEWKTDDLKVLDRNTRKMITLYGALHPKTNVDRVHLAWQNGGRRLISCEWCVKAEENHLAWYVRNSNERLIPEVRKIKIDFAAQEQALRTNYVNIYRSVDSPLCRMCNEKGETNAINHILSECKMLAQKECKRRHDNNLLPDWSTGNSVVSMT